MNFSDDESEMIFNKNLNNKKSKIDLDLIKVHPSILLKTISNLENRINTCNEIYNISLSSNEIRDNERNSILDNCNSFYLKIENKLFQFEEEFKNLNNIIKNKINDIYLEKKIQEKSLILIENYEKKIIERINIFENIFNENEKINSKWIQKITKEINELKSLNKFENNYFQIEIELENLKNKQNQINNLINKIKKL